MRKGRHYEFGTEYKGGERQHGLADRDTSDKVQVNTVRTMSIHMGILDMAKEKLFSFILKNFSILLRYK